DRTGGTAGIRHGGRSHLAPRAGRALQQPRADEQRAKTAEQQWLQQSAAAATQGAVTSRQCACPASMRSDMLRISLKKKAPQSHHPCVFYGVLVGFCYAPATFA